MVGKNMAEFKGPSSDTLKALETAPNMYLILSPNLYILTASNLYLQAIETTRETIVGKHIFEAFPTNPDFPNTNGVQNINASLQEVLRTKQPHYMQVQRYDVPDVNHPGKFIQRYWDPCHTPILDDAGNISYIIQLANNVTDKILTEQALAASQRQQEETVRQVQCLNVELSSMNDVLRHSQESLQLLNDQQEEQIFTRTNDLRLSENKYRSLIEQSPIAQQVFRGDDMTFELVNESMLQFLGKDSSIIGKPLFVGVPEIVGQPIVDLLYQVYRTGQCMEIKAIETTLHRNGKAETGYYDVSYRPLYDEGRITGVLGIAIDVTEQVNSRREIAEVNERLSIAIDAGGLGYTEVDLATGVMTCNDVFKRCYGRTKDEHFTYSDLYEAMLPEYRDEVAQRVAKAKAEQSLYQATYEVKWPDGSIRWINAHGRARYNNNGIADRMVGIVADVTEQKQDDQRKNDFIGMVSHELKTPLTSLTAFIQMLYAKAKKSDDTFTSGALHQANKQVKKMTAMINGFLNLSRLESGKINLDLQHFDIEKLIKEVEEEVSFSLHTHAITFHPCKPLFVVADRDKISQVITNFLSNAVKYSPKDKPIEVECHEIDGKVQLSVQDQGMGIGTQDIDKLFQRYYRVPTTNSTISGFGIGLYLCAEIIYRHHGKIWVNSELGKGSTFYFELSLASAINDSQ
jgi:two-component system sensor histidine kinase VicK